MGPLAVIFMQPAIRNFPDFIQCSEQVKIEYLCSVFSIKAFDKGILRRCTGFNKLQCYTMLLRPQRQRQRYELRPLSIHIFIE